MKKIVVFYLFCLLILANTVHSQNSVDKSIIKNKVLARQVIDYETYIKSVTDRYKIKEYTVAMDHKRDEEGDTYTLSVLFYPSEIDKFEPTGSFKCGKLRILVHDAPAATAHWNKKQLATIKQSYFKNVMLKEDSLKAIDAKLKQDDDAESPPVSSIQHIDDSIYPVVPVQPAIWHLIFSNGTLVIKNSTSAVNTQ